jgi:hypothetical protein
MRTRSDLERLGVTSQLITELSGTYSYDYDIKSAHYRVLAYLEQQKRMRTKELEYKLRKCENNDDISVMADETKRNKKIFEIKEEIENWKNDEFKELYLSRVSHIISNYRKLPPLQVTFGSNEPLHIDHRRISLINMYLEEAGEFIDVNVVHCMPEELKCDKCDTPMKRSEARYGVIVCSECSHSQILMDYTRYRSRKIEKDKSYDDWTNFHTQLLQFQGKIEFSDL